MSYSKLVERYVVSFATFFTLNIPDGILRRVFSEKNNFRLAPPPQPRLPPIMEITVGPPRLPIAEYSSATRIEYVQDKFMLDITGPIEEVIEVAKGLSSFFNDLGYDLDKMMRYVEINFPSQPIDVKDAMRGIRSITIFKGSEHLSKLVGSNVGVFSFSLSSPETPLTLNWLHLRVDPDVNSPNARLYISIIKRAEKMSEGIDFLTKIFQVIEAIKELLERGGSV
jgi:hypothetical protein